MADKPKKPIEADDDGPVDEGTVELVSYLDGELDRDRADEIEAKIGRDRKLRREAEELKRTWDLLDFLPRPEPSAEFANNTVSQVLPVPSARSSQSAPVLPSRSGSGPIAPAALAPPPVRKVNPLVLIAVIVACAVIGWLLQPVFMPRTDKAGDAILVNDIRILENLKLYRNFEDMAFLQSLDHPDLFGDDPFARE